MQTRYRRRDGGEPIRAAMEKVGLSGPALAKRAGLSVPLICFLASDGSSARETTSIYSGDQIARALGRKPAELFITETQVMRQVPTSEGEPA
jgi:transcriptional regulator with XRE-family HTH domain